MVNSRTPINERQAELLERIAGGDTLSSAADVEHRRSAYALRDRGLVTVSKRAGVFTAQVTDRGRYRLDHDHYPEHDERTGSVAERPRPWHRRTPAGTSARTARRAV
jgi:hypothetical protein